MAEQEVIKHTKKAYQILRSKHDSLFYKIKDFVIEILIIVFAITISIWFHNWSEHREQQKDVKEFLLGLKADLQNDIKEMKDDSLTFVKTAAAFKYIVSLKYGEVVSNDSLKKYWNYIFNTTGLLRYSNCIRKSERIIQLIDQMYSIEEK